MTVRIKNNPKRAIVSASEAFEPSDEVKLRIIAWLVSEVTRKLDVHEVELAYDAPESD